MSVIEARDGHTSPHELPEQQTTVADRISQIWPVCVVALGLIATGTWMALLGWIVYRAVLILA